jgi:hypothetical protein
MGFKCRPRSILIDVAGSIGCLFGESTVRTEFKETFLTPVLSPRVADDPVFFAMASSLFIIDLAVSNESHSVVDLIFGVRAVQVPLSHHTFRVAHQHTSTVDSNSDRLLL